MKNEDLILLLKDVKNTLPGLEKLPTDSLFDRVVKSLENDLQAVISELELRERGT